MKNVVLTLIGNTKSSYLFCSIGSVFAICCLFISVFTDLSVELAGGLLIFSVFFYTLSWVAYVWKNRRTLSSIIRECRALRVEIERDKAAASNLMESQKKISRSLELFEANLMSALTEYQESYRRELKTQAFNSHLAIEEFKASIIAERDCDE